jgi:hypothetical protein
MRAFSARKLVAAVVTAATLTASLAATSSAQAKMPFKPMPFPAHMHHHGFGGGAGAALIGGLAIGAIAAAASEDDGCYVVTKRVFDEDGNVYLRRVTVCE